MYIALMSHDNKKELMVQFCSAYAGVLSRHNLCATNTTGKMVSEATGLHVHRFLTCQHGGSQQIGARTPTTPPWRRSCSIFPVYATRTTSPLPATWPPRRCWCWAWTGATWIGGRSSTRSTSTSSSADGCAACIYIRKSFLRGTCVLLLCQGVLMPVAPGHGSKALVSRS